jgi:hypothetical protein
LALYNRVPLCNSVAMLECHILVSMVRIELGL